MITPISIQGITIEKIAPKTTMGIQSGGVFTSFLNFRLLAISSKIMERMKTPRDEKLHYLVIIKAQIC